MERIIINVSMPVCFTSVLLTGIFMLKAASVDEDKSKYGLAFVFWYTSLVSLCGILIGINL